MFRVMLPTLAEEKDGGTVCFLARFGVSRSLFRGFCSIERFFCMAEGTGFILKPIWEPFLDLDC